jgi:hypothetical protein
MSDPVWKPPHGDSSEPLDSLIRAARRLLPVGRSDATTRISMNRNLTLDLGEWGEAAEVSLRYTLTGAATFNGRDVIAFRFGGEIASRSGQRTFSGRAFIDQKTTAVLDISASTALTLARQA